MININANNQMIEGIGLVIFDKDGTLMDLYHYWSQMVGFRAEFICQQLGLDAKHYDNIMFEMGVDSKVGKLRPEGPVGLKKREIVLQAAVDYLSSIGYLDTHNLCFEAFKEVDNFSSENLRQFIRPIDGANDIVNILSENGCKIAIATTDVTERAKLAMEFLGIADKIDFIAGADMVSNSKPDPEMIHIILNTLNIDRSNAVIVGDAITDVQLGINAGLKASIGVLTGLSTKNVLRKLTPYVIKNIGGLRVEIYEI